MTMNSFGGKRSAETVCENEQDRAMIMSCTVTMYAMGNAVFSKKAIELGQNKCQHTFTFVQYRRQTLKLNTWFHPSSHHHSSCPSSEKIELQKGGHVQNPLALVSICS